jgi:streptomycin 6-kinase
VVPDVVRAKAAVDGDGGAGWVAALPGVVADLEQAWSIRVGHQVLGGASGVVARAVTVAGDPVVVKVAVPDPGFLEQVRTLREARGGGYVRLLAHDADRRAVLLESLGTPLDRSGLAPEAQLRILCALLRRAWEVPPDDATGADGPVDKARGLHELVTRLWEGLGRPCPEPVVALALQCAERRSAAFDPGRCVVVHGDAAAPNAAAVPAPRPGAEGGFVLIDPEPFLGDPAYDLGVAVRDWCPQLISGDAAALVRHYAAVVAEASGAEETAVWEWGYLERVSTGLFGLSFGAEELARPSLRTAELVWDGERRR